MISFFEIGSWFLIQESPILSNWRESQSQNHLSNDSTQILGKFNDSLGKRRRKNIYDLPIKEKKNIFGSLCALKNRNLKIEI